MADAGGSQLNIGALVEKRGRDRPRGSKNKSKDPAAASLSSVPIKRRPGRPLGSKNKTKMSTAASGPSAPPCNASPPPFPGYTPSASPTLNAVRFSGCLLKFTKFMDGRELREAVLREHSG
jgi:hypothetical protein